MNYCRSCNRDFGSLTAFDAHRVGKHEYDYSEERPDGRRCLDADELSTGWHQDKNERWRKDISEDAVFRLRQLRRSADTTEVRGRVA